MKVTVTIERGMDGTYQAHFSNERMPFGLAGDSMPSAKEAIEDFYVAHEEMKEYYQEIGKDFPVVKYEFKYDMSSFLQYYAYAFTLAGLSRITGVNQHQLSHYINGVRRPSEKTVRKIEERIHAFGKEIAAVSFV